MFKKIGVCLIGLALCLALSGWLDVQTASKTMAAKGGKNQPVEVPGCAVFRDDEFDAVQSDELGPDYCEAEITELVDKHGELPDWHDFSVHPYRKRDLSLDFSWPADPLDVFNDDQLAEFGSEGHDPPFQTGVVEFGWLNSSKWGPRPQLLNMVPGQTEQMRLLMRIRDPESRKSYLIYFGHTVNNHVWSGSDNILVTANDTDGDLEVDSWTFEPLGAGSLVLLEKGSGQQTRKGVFYLPFALDFVPDAS